MAIEYPSTLDVPLDDRIMDDDSRPERSGGHAPADRSDDAGVGDDDDWEDEEDDDEDVDEDDEVS